MKTHFVPEFFSVLLCVPCSAVKHTDVPVRELCFVETKDETRSKQGFCERQLDASGVNQ